MSQSCVPTTPHAGFSAVTYMFEDSPGTFSNRSCKGDATTIAAGTVYWTQAASGMMHEQIPNDPGTSYHGLQMFVKLAVADELAEPAAFHLDANDIVELTPDNGVRIRILAGNFDGTDAGIDPYTSGPFIMSSPERPEHAYTGFPRTALPTTWTHQLRGLALPKGATRQQRHGKPRIVVLTGLTHPPPHQGAHQPCHTPPTTPTSNQTSCSNPPRGTRSAETDRWRSGTSAPTGVSSAAPPVPRVARSPSTNSARPASWRHRTTTRTRRRRSSSWKVTSCLPSAKPTPRSKHHRAPTSTALNTRHSFRCDSEVGRVYNTLTPGGFDHRLLTDGTPATIVKLPPPGVSAIDVWNSLADERIPAPWDGATDISQLSEAQR